MKLKINETNAKTKATNLFKHPMCSPKIKTFAIFTGENRDKRTDYTSAENKYLNNIVKRDLSHNNTDFNNGDDSDNTANRLVNKGLDLNKLEQDLNSGYYSYYKVKGNYDNIEHSFIVYNIRLDDMKRLCEKYGQQSFIYGYNDKGTLKFEFWANKCKTSNKYKYFKIDECDTFNLLDDNAKNYYTQISRKFKFSIPFTKFEFAPNEMIEAISRKQKDNNWSDNDVDYFINESLDDNINPKYRYYARANLLAHKE